MSKGPGLFRDFAKKSRDLLYKDYLYDQKISISSKTKSGLALSSYIAKQGSLSSGQIATQFISSKAAFDVKLDTDLNQLSSTITVTDLLPSTKTIASMNLPNQKTGKLEVQYLHHHASFSLATELNTSAAVDISAAVGTPTVAFGAEAGYVPTSSTLSKYNAGVSFSKPEYSVSAILADKGDSIKVSFLRCLVNGALVGEISRRFSTNENTLTVGCSYVVDSQTVVKGKLNNHGNLSALVRHEVKPNSFVTFSGGFDTKDLNCNPKIGVGLSLSP